MKIYFLTLLFAAAALVPAGAKESKTADATMVPTSDAALSALAAVVADSQNRQAQLNGRTAAIQKQLADIKAKVKDKKIEVGEQLSKEDLDAFNLLNAQLRYLQDAATVEAVRQKNLAIARDIYRASFFTATMMSEYIGDRGGLDDGFDDFCRTKAKTYGLETPVALLFNVQDYIIDAGEQKK
jgi:hypothetical protein